MNESAPKTEAVQHISPEGVTDISYMRFLLRPIAKLMQQARRGLIDLMGQEPAPRVPSLHYVLASFVRSVSLLIQPLNTFLGFS